MFFDSRRGIWYGISAYFLWGTFPLYFRLLRLSGPIEIVLHRITWSALLCGGLVAVCRNWTGVRAVLTDRGKALLLAAAATILSVNWGVYVYAVNSDHVIESSLGYYINPLVSVLLGVLVLGERLRPLQWTAVALGGVAVAVLTVDYGRLPWIALVLAISFGTYGLCKNRIGGSVGALDSLTVETLFLVPFAAAAVVWVELTGRGHFTASPPWQGLLLMTAGIVTVVPLLLFAAAARRVPLSTMGLLQYVTPTLQLLIAVLLFGEHMPASRWAGFALVWGALVLLTADMLRPHRDHALAGGHAVLDSRNQP
jgi:chloramphenicol-sensitive protein RarD